MEKQKQKKELSEKKTHEEKLKENPFYLITGKPHLYKSWQQLHFLTNWNLQLNAVAQDLRSRTIELKKERLKLEERIKKLEEKE